jgi:hypothetical protein
MTISFDLPTDLEQQLRLSLGDLGQAAKEALAIRGYTERKFGASTVRRLLGFETRWEAESWLSEHGIAKNYSVTDFRADCDTLRSLTSEKL